MCDLAMSSSFSNQSMAKKHTWNGDVVTTQEDRFSPSRDSLDSGFSSFPASPNSSSSNIADAPPQLVNCSLFNNELDNATDTLTEDEDEPACKMPRLLPIDEETEDEIDCQQESTIPLSPPVPDKEEDEPKPETANIPVIEKITKLGTKRVRIATPNEEVDENEDPYAKCFKPQHPCQWAECSEAFFDVNDLYDHTMKQHFNSLRPSDSPSTSSSVRRGAIARDDKKEAASEQKYRCQWRECEMSLKRGEETKKFDWLQSHFRARHAPKAQPLKCLMDGCPIRFQNLKALNAHLLNSHDDRPARKTQQPVVKQISCYDYAVPVRTESYGVFDFFDKYTFGLIGKRVEQYYANNDEENYIEEKPIQQIPCMPQNKTITVLKKLFARS